MKGLKGINLSRCFIKFDATGDNTGSGGCWLRDGHVIIQTPAPEGKSKMIQPVSAQNDFASAVLYPNVLPGS